MNDRLTVAELAQALGGDDSEVELLIRRLRHWTLAGVITPADGTHTGPGRHRRYTKSSVYVVSILNVLANMQLPITLLKLISEDLAWLAGFVGIKEPLIKFQSEQAEWSRSEARAKRDRSSEVLFGLVREPLTKTQLDHAETARSEAKSKKLRQWLAAIDGTKHTYLSVAYSGDLVDAYWLDILLFAAEELPKAFSIQAKGQVVLDLTLIFSQISS